MSTETQVVAPRSRRLIAWGTGVALLVGAWFVAWGTPDGEDRIADPFFVTATLGSPVETDSLRLTITSATLADRVEFAGWYADGTWLVVDLDAEVLRRDGVTLRLAYLAIGERTYLASERPGRYDSDASLTDVPLRIDLPRSGTLAFELPDDVLTETAQLEISLGTPADGLDRRQTQRGAAVVQLPLDLSSLDREAVRTLPEVTWTTP